MHRFMQKPAPKISAYMTPNPIAVGLHEPLANAYALMRKHNVHHIPVLVGDKLVGLVADPDVKTFELLARIDLHKLRVEEAMIPVPFAVTEDTKAADVLREMVLSHHDAAVVMRDSQVIGVFTAKDAIRALSELLNH